jgi:hypothetical protein
MKTLFANILFAVFLLGACSGDNSNTGPGGVSAEDGQALDEAAAKLDRENVTPSK